MKEWLFGEDHPPDCPECSEYNNVIPILYENETEKYIEEKKKGKIILKDPNTSSTKNHYCKSCENEFYVPEAVSCYFGIDQILDPESID